MKDDPICPHEIDFIRPRIKEDGWYYGDHSADEIANNAIDDLEVCFQRIDELEARLSITEAALSRRVAQELKRLP